MSEDRNTIMEEPVEAGEYERTGEVIETVEFTLTAPKEGTLVTGSDPEGFDQTPVPEIKSGSPNYFIDKVTVNGIEREEVYWREYSTLLYYSDVCMKAGETYTVFGRVKAKPGYIFNDPVTLIINGEEVPGEGIEDYTLEGDSFTFYCDITAVK